MPKMSDFKMTIAMNYFDNKSQEYCGTVLCLTNNRYQLIAPDETRKLLPEGTKFAEAARELLGAE